MDVPDRTRCAALGCTAPPAGSYLDASRTVAIMFAVCEFHLAVLKAGRAPVVLDGADGRRPALLFP